MSELFAGRTEVLARAVLVGERIEVRALENAERLASSPSTVAVGTSGCAVLFRYGVVVFFGVEAMEEATFLDQLQRLVTAPCSGRAETESLRLHIAADGRDQVANGELRTGDARIERLQVIADILAKSVVLAEYEARVGKAFDEAEPQAAAMAQKGTSAHRGRQLIRDIGSGLHSLHRMVGRVEVGEKPEILWEKPELELLYVRLEDEYELKERQLALERKLDVISRTAETQLELLQARRTLRVEWYITILIVIEIMLTLYEMFIRGGTH
ncbi:MAG: RMD1 family protein [Chromatiales bacterium]|nr:RMD1 family protein [Chromatiales bacterium]